MSIKYTGSGDPKNFIDPLARERIMHIDSKGGLSELYPKHPTHDELDLSIPLDATFDNGSNGAQQADLKTLNIRQPAQYTAEPAFEAAFFGNNAADPPMTEARSLRFELKQEEEARANVRKTLSERELRTAVENWYDALNNEYVLVRKRAEAAERDLAEAFEDLEVVFGALETEQKLHADARKEATSWKDAYNVFIGSP
jgi:chromosome segregation ATPase